MERRIDPARPSNEAYKMMGMAQNAIFSKMESIKERWEDLAGDELDDTNYDLEDIGFSKTFSLD
jgi:hypothetical protein